MNEANQKTVSALSLEHLQVSFDSENHCVWANMRYPGRPCMSRGLLADMAQAQMLIREVARAGHEVADPARYRYQVLQSDLPGVFNLGGDLAHFVELIRQGDRAGLFQYGKTCIDILYPSYTGYGLPFTSIALVQGEALGGGFEAALSSKVIIAERGATFGFPETVFGMFPGMGAYSFLVRRLSPALAKRVIASGKVYSAEELYDLGVVDVLAENGEGVAAVQRYIRHQSTRSQGFMALERVVDQYNPVSQQELMNVIEIWVDTALGLSHKNLRLMEYLVQAQQSRWGDAAGQVASLQLARVG